MALPTTRDEFKDHCLRKLGWPVIQINIDEMQVEDAVYEALAYYRDYHHDATEHVYVKHVVTATEITNQYIDVPESLIGISKVWPIGSTYSSNNMFSVKYQMALSDAWGLRTGTSQSMVPYYVAMRHIELLEELLVGVPHFRFNKHTDRLHIDIDWNLITEGQYIIIEGYEYLDPDEYTDVWSDRWLTNYCTSLIKKQWGNNLKKFDGIQMIGNTTFNGQKIYDEAVEEIKEAELQMSSTYSFPPSDEIG